MLNNKNSKSAVVERVGSCIAVFAPQLYAVVEGNFKNILAKAKVSQLSNWLCLMMATKIQMIAVAILRHRDLLAIVARKHSSL